MKNSYDVIIVGSGLGGLQTAYILSKKGFNVCVLEKNESIGGTLQNFKMGECSFSTGMHYLGSLDDGQVLNKLFRYFNILEKLQLQRMDPDGFDHFRIGSKEYAYPMGWNAFEEKMTNYFPSENKAIKKYITLIKEVSDSQDIYNLRPPVNNDIRANKYLQTGIYPSIQKITKNKDLQNALCALNFVYAGDKNNSPLYTHALINNYYIKSAYQLIGGSGQIADLLAQNASSMGATIYTNKQADKFLFKGDQLIGVRTTDKEEFFAKDIISNIHPATTLEMVEKGKVRKSFRNRLSKIPNTISVFGIHLHLKSGTFPKLNHNYYHYKNDDVWPVSSYNSINWPDYYYMYTPAKAGGSEFADCISIYTYMQFDEVEKWKNLPVNNRGEDYEIWKREKAEKLIAFVSERFPLLKQNIIDWMTVTPLTYRDYIGTPNGGMYGTLRDYHNPMASYVFPRTKIPNLYFTGQNINLHGMLGVSISTLLTCGEFVGLHDLIKEVNEA